MKVRADSVAYTRDPEAPPLSPQLQAIADACRAARAKGQGLFRLALTPADYAQARLVMLPTSNPDVGMIGTLPVHRAKSASRSHLWVRANDGQLGNLLAVPL